MLIDVRQADVERNYSHSEMDEGVLEKDQLLANVIAEMGEYE